MRCPLFTVEAKFFTAIFCYLLLNNSIYAETMHVPRVEIYDDRALEIIDINATFEVLGDGYSWTEGPLWLPDEELLIFSDIPENSIYQYKKGEGVRLYLKPSGATGISEFDSQQGGNGLLLNRQGQLVIMQQGDRRVAVMDAPLNLPEAKFKTLVAKYDNARLNSPNDGVFHSNGDLYFTDPPYGLKNREKDIHKKLPFDGIYRLTANGEIKVEDKSVHFPNGIALTNNESSLIVAASDTKAAKWYQFDVAKDGSLANKRVFYDASNLVGKEEEKGLPDGMVVHSKGYIFATGPGGVFIFTESGTLLAKLRTGKATSNCTLSSDQKTLFMTAHDTLMAIQLK